MSISHWSDKYIGAPWVAYASGPAAYDCWGLVYCVLRDEFGLCSVSRYTEVITDDARGFHAAILREMRTGKWRKIENPCEGAVVLMAQKKIFMHIGLFTSGVVLHARDGAATCRESLSALAMMGFSKVEFWVHESLLSDT